MRLGGDTGIRVPLPRPVANTCASEDDTIRSFSADPCLRPLAAFNPQPTEQVDAFADKFAELDMPHRLRFSPVFRTSYSPVCILLLCRNARDARYEEVYTWNPCKGSHARAGDARNFLPQAST